MKGIAVAVFACTVALALGVPPRSSGVSRPGQRIIGGSVAAAGEFPWHVSVQFYHTMNGWEHWCDGSILSNEFVITDWVCGLMGTSDGRVVAGSLNWAVPGTVHNISEVITDNLLVVLRLDPPLEFDSNVGPVKLPAPNAESPPGTVMTVSGWGEAAPFYPSDALEKLDVSIVSKDDCAAVYPDQNVTQYVCAKGASSEESLCSHSSAGAPLVLNGELRGLYSHSHFTECADPSMYLEVSLFTQFLSNFTSISTR